MHLAAGSRRPRLTLCLWPDVDLHGTTSHDAFTHLTQEAAQWACGRERRCVVRAYDVPLPTTALRGCFALA